MVVLLILYITLLRASRITVIEADIGIGMSSLNINLIYYVHLLVVKGIHFFIVYFSYALKDKIDWVL